MYEVTITYVGMTPDNDQFVTPIPRLYRPMPSYADTPAFEGTVYDTNVPRIGGMIGPEAWGYIELMEPFASTSIPFPVPLTQFKMAVVGTPDADGLNHTVTFTVEDYKEAFIYKQLAVTLADQGFEITVDLI